MREARRRQEAVRSNAQGGMVMEAAPVAPFVMRQAKLLLQFPIIALDTPAHLGDEEQLVDGSLCRCPREPATIRYLRRQTTGLPENGHWWPSGSAAKLPFARKISTVLLGTTVMYRKPDNSLKVLQ